MQQQKFSANSLSSARKNKIDEEIEDHDISEQTCSLLESHKNPLEMNYNTSPKSQDYYQWVNGNNTDSLSSDTYSPSSFTPPLLIKSQLHEKALATTSTSSTNSCQNSPPFPVLNKHLLNYDSSLTMVSRVPPLPECSSSSASSTSGCSSYESKTLNKPLSKINRSHFSSMSRRKNSAEIEENNKRDYENFRYIQNSPKKHDLFPILKKSQNSLGTFKAQRYDYV